MNFINSVLNSFFDFFFYPFESLNPMFGLCAISLFTAIIVLPIFRYTSDQDGIKRTRSVIMGHFLELRLFKDDLRMVLSAQKNILKYNMIYLRYTLRPLVFMMVPVVIIIVQTGVRYEYRPLKPGESAIVKLKFHNPNKLSEKNGKIALIVSDGLSVETPPLRIDGGRETYWRIRAEEEGVFDLAFQGRHVEVKKKVFVTDEVTRLSPETLKGNILNSFFHPGEPLLTEGAAIKSVEIKYPHGKIRLFGWNIHWLVVFFILTLVFGFVLMKPFKVRI